MNRIEYKLMEVAESVSGAVSTASDTALTIVAGQVAGLGADWIDKMFLSEEDGSHYRQQDEQADGEARVGSLDRKRAAKMARKLSKNVSTPPDLII